LIDRDNGTGEINMNRLMRKIAFAGTAACLGAGHSTFTEAALPDITVFRNAVEVSDLELGMQRGRYVGRGRIMYFGIEMLTEWRTARGEVIHAGLNLSVNRRSFRPVVHIVPTAGITRLAAPPATGSPATAGTPTPITSGGLETVKGVGQVVQVTGDTNSVRNDITLDLRTTDGGGPPGSIVPELPAQDKQASAVSMDSGATVQAGADSKNLGVVVAVPGQGIVTQNITGMTGLKQNVRLSGDMNRVMNQLNLSAEFSAVSNPGVSSMRSTFRSMRGVPLQGMF